MGTIKNISTFPYEGLAYNFLVSVAGEKNSNQKSLFDGYVHPEYPIYNNDGLVYKASETKVKDVILDKDSNHWVVENVITHEVNEDFLCVDLSDGRRFKCSTKHKLKVISPKSVQASNLSVNDVLQDVSLDKVQKRIRSILRN